MSDARLPDDLDALVEGWLDGTLDAAEERRLGRRVARDPDAALRMARGVLVHDRLRDLLRVEAAAAGGGPVLPASPVAARKRSLSWLALPALAAVALLCVMVAFRPEPATAAAALDRLARVSGVGDRTYAVRVVDHGPGGPRVVASEAGGRKPGVDGARLSVRGADRFVLVRTFGDGTRHVDGSDGSVGWSVPPTGRVHVSRDAARYRRGVPGEGVDIPFIALPENLLRLRRGYRLTLEGTAADGSRRLVAERDERRRRGPARVAIRFDAGGTPLSIAIDGLDADDAVGAADAGPRSVVLELESRDDLGPSFFDHASHHAPDRPLHWE